MRRLAIGLAACALAGCAVTETPPAPEAAPARPADTDMGGLLSYRDLLARPRPPGAQRIAYGPGPQQFGELRLPDGPGPHRVAVLIHGGCWQASLPGLELVDEMAEGLRRAGWAVWNVEYRRLGHDGGGYPGTFQDVAAATDFLRTLAPRHNLDLTRVVTTGHSAGGHLALWVAGRPRLPAGSPLRTADPLPIRGVVPVAGINDLEAYRADGPDACGGPGTIDALVGASARARQDVYADTNPARLLPLGVRVIAISGARDPIVPPIFGSRYQVRASGSGDTQHFLWTLPSAGHFELIDPTSRAWNMVVRAMESILQPSDEVVVTSR